MCKRMSQRFFAAGAVLFFLAVSIYAWGTTSPSEGPSQEKLAAEAASLNKDIPLLEPLHKKKGKPQPGEWLYQFRENGQTFAQYLQVNPITARGQRRVLYIQPLGEFNETEREILKKSAEYMQLYFCLPVKTLPDLPLKTVPEKARRKNPYTKNLQLLTTYILDDVLKPKLPKDAAALISLTAVDLYPEESWNFVFGQASLRSRVAVYSMARKQEPNDFTKSLRRVIKTATHETGHMFTIRHCIKWECNMNGCNSLPESDRNPLWLCPECWAKTIYAVGTDGRARYTALIKWCKENKMNQEAEFFQKSLDLLNKK